MIKRLLIVLAVVSLLGACAASSGDVITPPPTLDPNIAADVRAINAQETAAIAYATSQAAERDAKRAAAAVTASFNATQSALMSMVTQEAIHVQATRNAQDTHATVTAQVMQATVTAQAAQYTATMQAMNNLATSTAQAQFVQATAASASATATAREADAHATQVSAGATETVIAAQVKTAQAQADWETFLAGVGTASKTIVIVLASVGGLLIVGYLSLRLVDAAILRIRVIRDGTGQPFVILEPDRQGRQTMLAPTRAPGPVVTLTAPDRQTLQVGAPVADPETTRRAQAVDLMLASGNGRGNVERVAGLLEEGREVTDLSPIAHPSVQVVKPFEPRPLDLQAQPSRLALPIGVTKDREMWIPLSEVTHALIGGPSGMGKSNLLHGWIQSLTRGEQADVALYDGKSGMEFERYASAPRVEIVPDQLTPFLEQLVGEMQRRFELMRSVGVNNLADYNRYRDTDDRLARRVLIVDELYTALQNEGAEELLTLIATKGRAEGLHLILATQLPDANSVPRHIRINALLRIAFACPTYRESHTILGYSGAERIQHTPGRLLVFWQGQLIEAQAFRAELPTVSPAMLAPVQAPAQLDAPRQFDNDTERIVRHALDAGQGWFIVTEIAAACGIRQSRVSRIARNLEEAGYLTEVQKDDKGQNRGRQITEKLRACMAV
ncbi:MAG: FtsK/SpoIIIE domain-containing protein [Anaerolineae bacterium]